MKPYYTVCDSFQNEIPLIKGSRFIALVSPVTDDNDAKQFIESVKLRYPDARHWCWAYQLQDTGLSRFSDDGEPSGSAGKPILAPIQGRDLFDVCVVVVRYFGGVKLGVGGLVRAYSQATNAVLDAAKIVQVIPKKTIQLTYQYTETSHVAAALAYLGLEEANAVYTDIIQSILQVEPDEVDNTLRVIQEYSSNKVQAFVLEN
ncbi:MAG: YigZ family protein [Gammaproteobacteria bacterium]|nr:YigZ family protein [Gammaproteobacteria bacterium]